MWFTAITPPTSSNPATLNTHTGISLPAILGGDLNTIYKGNNDAKPANVTHGFDEFMSTYTYEKSHSIPNLPNIPLTVGFANGMAAPIQNMNIGNTRSTHPMPGIPMSRSCVGGGF